MLLNQEAALIERYHFRDRDELYAQPQRVIEHALLAMDADQKAAAASRRA